MTILVETIHKYVGLSSDTKPTDSPAGSLFYETDTTNTYIYNGTTWVVAVIGLWD